MLKKMFDYIRNRYNIEPSMVKKLDLKDNNLYVKFLNAPYMLLPKNMEDFLFTHKSKFWYNLNRFEKMFRNDFGELYFEVVRDEKKLEIFLDKVYILFNKKWKDEYLSTPWKCKEGFETYKQAMIEMSKDNEGFLAVLYNESSELLSYSYCLNDDTTVYFYQYTTEPNPIYHKYSLGKVLVHNLLKYVISEQKYKMFDFMNGEQAYKLEWAKQSESVYIKIGKKSFKNYIKYYLLKVKVYLQFNGLLRDKLKNLLKMKEKFLGKC